LQNLESLNVSRNELTSLPESLSSLGRLRHLDLESNLFEEIPDWVSRLTQLNSLSVGSGHRHIELSATLAHLSNLTELRLTYMRLEKLPPWLSDMTRLSTLDIRGNLLRGIPPEIFALSNLSYLCVGANPLDEIDPRLSTLANLENLLLFRAGLSALPLELKNLSKLESLSLWANRFEEIPRVVFELPNLRLLNLQNDDPLISDNDDGQHNKITEVPQAILTLPNLSILRLENNPIKSPPPEIVFKGLSSIRDYFTQVDEAGTDFLYEAKLLILGEPGAGKTSLMQKIVNPDFPLNEAEQSTEGIEVFGWKFSDNNREFTVNIWDFGGQEIYHATHQFFLTKRSLYVVVADTRKEDTDFFYWLNVIELLGGSSPVVIVKNEKQERHREIDVNQLRMRFSNLASIDALNLATNRGLQNVVSEICYHIARLPHIGTPLPKTWVDVRKALEQHPGNVISFDTYESICDSHNFTTLSDKITLVEYLNDIGVCVHFRHDPLLQKILILKPKWGTDAVYRVLDNKSVIQRFGRFDRSDLASMWHEPEYHGLQDELLQLMLNFKIC
jgi:internalin A